ncbi:MAG: nucleotidyltransferase substrate binding protein [Blautia glucerasea]|nr:nucleotidyltransferase substrate binding protein [Blautia glucerasea]
MKKLDNFSNYLSILKNADFKFAETNDIYRTGIIGQFNLTFELAWKAAFVNLEKLLNKKLNEVQNDWA